MARDNEVGLGDVVKDQITGFKGVVVGVTKWIHGCRRITVQPEAMKDGKPIDPVAFDEPQLDVMKRGKHETTALTGGPGPIVAKRTDATR